MRATISNSFALIAIFFAQTSVACDKPGEITIPNGTATTAEEMTAAGQNFHQFMLNMQLYQVCLEDEANQERSRSGKDNESQIQARENGFVSWRRRPKTECNCRNWFLHEFLQHTNSDFLQIIEIYK